jgi:hypothetical protein
MLRDIVSNNILSFVVPNTHRDKMLYFVLNILLAIIIWLCVTTLISYNIYGFIQVLRSSNKVLSTANKITPIFYGVIPQSVNKYIEPLIAKLGIDPNKLTNLPREYVKLDGLAEIPPLEPQTLEPQTLPSETPQIAPPTLQTLPSETQQIASPTLQTLPSEIPQIAPPTLQTPQALQIVALPQIQGQEKGKGKGKRK